MKKSFAVFFIAIFTIGMFAGCDSTNIANNQSTNSNTQQVSTAAPIKKETILRDNYDIKIHRDNKYFQGKKINKYIAICVEKVTRNKTQDGEKINIIVDMVAIEDAPGLDPIEFSDNIFALVTDEGKKIFTQHAADEETTNGWYAQKGSVCPVYLAFFVPDGTHVNMYYSSKADGSKQVYVPLKVAYAN